MKFPFFHLKTEQDTTMNSNHFPLKTATGAIFPVISATEVSLLTPTEEQIKIGDIATGLSNICRFGGQVSRFYSVAQHSLLVSALAPVELKKEALLHDASEAFLGDVISPLKALLGEAYSVLEFNFQTVIFQKFGLQLEKLEAVKEFDLKALELENLFLRKNEPWRLMEALGNASMIIGGTEAIYRPLVAKMEFLRVFTELFPHQSTEEA